MCVAQMITEGLSKEEARERIYLMDVGGLITKHRDLTDQLHVPYAKDMADTKDLLEVS